jgi:enamine deaminase RidA (YjgF/YER057c/UK114 family)
MSERDDCLVNDQETKQYINPEELSSPPGGIYTHVVVTGRTIYVSGQLARDAAGNVIGEGDAIAQYRQAWSNVEHALAAVGATSRDIVKSTTFVVGPENIPDIRFVRQELLPPGPPASTMVVVAALADPRFLVEIEVIAVRH